MTLHQIDGPVSSALPWGPVDALGAGMTVTKRVGLSVVRYDASLRVRRPVAQNALPLIPSASERSP